MLHPRFGIKLSPNSVRDVAPRFGIKLSRFGIKLSPNSVRDVAPPFWIKLSRFVKNYPRTLFGMLHPRFGIKLSRFVKNYTVFSLNYPVFLSRFVSKTTLGACRQPLVPAPMGASLPAGSLRLCAAPDQVADSPIGAKLYWPTAEGRQPTKLLKQLKYIRKIMVLKSNISITQFLFTLEEFLLENRVISNRRELEWNIVEYYKNLVIRDLSGDFKLDKKQFLSFTKNYNQRRRILKSTSTTLTWTH